LLDLPAQRSQEGATVTDRDDEWISFEEVDPDGPGRVEARRGEDHIGHLVTPESTVSGHAELTRQQDDVESGVPPRTGRHRAGKTQALVAAARRSQDARVP
jgi:hypothetical protein